MPLLYPVGENAGGRAQGPRTSLWDGRGEDFLGRWRAGAVLKAQLLDPSRLGLDSKEEASAPSFP